MLKLLSYGNFLLIITILFIPSNVFLNLSYLLLHPPTPSRHISVTLQVLHPPRQLLHLPAEPLRLIGHPADRGLKRVVHLHVLLLLGHLAKRFGVACHPGQAVQVHWLDHLWQLQANHLAGLKVLPMTIPEGGKCGGRQRWQRRGGKLASIFTSLLLLPSTNWGLAAGSCLLRNIPSIAHFSTGVGIKAHKYN